MQITHIRWRRPDLERSGTVAVKIDGVEVSTQVIGGARPQFEDALKVFEAALDSFDSLPASQEFVPAQSLDTNRVGWRETVRSRYNRIGRFRVIERGGQSGCCAFRMVEPSGSMGERTLAAWYISCLGRVPEWLSFPLEAMPVMWPSSRASENLVIRVLGEPTYETPVALPYWGTSDWISAEDRRIDEFFQQYMAPEPSSLEE